MSKSQLQGRDTLQDEISISFCISNNYAQHLAVVVTSILFHSSGVFKFHVLNKDLSVVSRVKLRQMETLYPGRCTFVFHAVDRSRFDTFPLPLEHITQEMYYRYLLPEILQDEARTIYMDVDVLVLADLHPLWKVDLGECLLAGISDPKEKLESFKTYKQCLDMNPNANYFNSGVLLMDLEELRRIKFCERCMQNTKKYSNVLAWPDQDVINLTMEGQILELPMRFNCMNPQQVPKGEHVVIRHFIGPVQKPWCCIYKNKVWKQYLYYLWFSSYRCRALAFLISRIKVFLYCRYKKQNIERVLICNIVVWKQVNKGVIIE